MATPSRSSYAGVKQYVTRRVNEETIETLKELRELYPLTPGYLLPAAGYDSGLISHEEYADLVCWLKRHKGWEV